MRNVRYLVVILLSFSLMLIPLGLPFFVTDLPNLVYLSSSLLGVAVALFSTFSVMWYEKSKQDREFLEKRKNSLAIVYTDITQALGPLENAPKNGGLFIHPLSCVGWSIFTTSGSFSLKRELDRKIADFYERLAALNNMIGWTVSMRLGVARAITGSSKVTKQFDGLIQTQIQGLIPRLKTVKSEIEKELKLPEKKEGS